ncbi:MAG: thymidine kinase [Opitutaceae bacterium]|nr:thymidine kinase [Opitutaceae bacterium]
MAKVYFYYAAMNAGKSTVLLQASYNYRERGMRPLLFTPSIDTRYGTGRIESRIGLRSGAISLAPGDNLLTRVRGEHTDKPVACVLIDEAQFLTAEQVWQAAEIADTLDIPVLCYGLRTDFRGKLFTGSATLLAIADDLSELKTICHCGRKATMNLRVDKAGRAVREGAQIEVGGNDRYVAMCRRHFKAALVAGSAPHSASPFPFPYPGSTAASNPPFPRSTPMTQSASPFSAFPAKPQSAQPLPKPHAP